MMSSALISPSERNERARLTKGAERPSPRAMTKALLLPGIPSTTLNVGERVSTSNSIEAVFTVGWRMAKYLSGVRWVEAATSASLDNRSSRIASPSAAPSCGSVPAPSSSSSINESASASLRIETMFPMWEENVERFCSIDCSSPMSLRTFAAIASSESGEAGMGMTDWVISVNSPIVFKVTVFPPVLGPVITVIRVWPPRESEIGTTLFSGSRG